MLMIEQRPVTKFTWNRALPIKGIVIHTTEGKEVARSAENTVAWWRNPLAKGSAHYVVSDSQILQCVQDANTAWHCNADNPWTLGVELVGSAKQIPEEWADSFSTAVLSNAADLVALLCGRYSIPAERITGNQILTKQRGIFGHVDSNLARGIKGGHYDPGPNFPWDTFLELVRCRL